jgi:hypothetical protein
VDIVDIPPTLILPLRGGRKLFFLTQLGYYYKISSNFIFIYVSFFIGFRLFEHVFQNDFRVTIPLVLDCFFPILNRFLWAPLKTGQALFASVKPSEPFIDHLDIAGRTDFQADPAAIAFIVHPEILVQFVNRSKRHLIDP